ncbi:MAG: NAD(P)/FAD-dependent oxidoreductase [Nanoarchaeota archaeon]|nr:NAD(P)/FAD-dependent oxidoreductase [Nanoarchaeota archaeon]MBU1631898.1 NAD(P)/FAD-dependent oxidoreductase [Nanoarchaeota archaeon]MBU1875915.1 NAD(P)/FAD-dependent oxidoreductase [Nanoarchaeota archaeon]
MNTLETDMEMNIKKDIVVIGAGPIGCYAAYLLAKSGHQVSVYEEHAELGSPIQCTGILTGEFDKFNFPKDSFLVNTINKIEVYSPKQKTTIQQKDYIICRRRFDNFLADLAKKEGAKIFLSHSFVRKEGRQLIIKDLLNKVEKNISPDVVIAADGPLSPTAKAYGFYYHQRKNYYGIQATVKGNFDSQMIKTYFGNEVCPNLFAWIVPESSTIARVGLATTKNTRHYFDRFMQEHNFIALGIQAGTIPVYHPKQKLKKDNCYAVGDASTYVKATTLGGIVPGLKQAEILVDCINNNKDYEREVKHLRKQMWTHLQIHKILNKFSDKDWDSLLSYINQPKIQKIFESYTRDNPIPLVTKTLLKEPRLLYFTKYLF